MKFYHNLYLKCDVLILADIFEKFRNNSLKKYGLCLSHEFSAPALSWAVMLSIKKVERELISEADMYLFIEKGMSGGVPYMSKRHSNVNNKYLKSYDTKQEPKYIIYLNASYLYGYEIFKFLSTGKFRWIDPKDFDFSKYKKKKKFKWLCCRS